MFEVILFNGQYQKSYRYSSLKLARKAVSADLPSQFFFPFAHLKGDNVSEFYGKSKEFSAGIRMLEVNPRGLTQFHRRFDSNRGKNHAIAV